MSSLEKQCSKCKQVLPVEMFNRRKAAKDGLSSRCRHCVAIAQSKWYYNGGQEKTRSYRRANPVKIITKKLVEGARRRAKEKNLSFDIDLDYIRSMVGDNAEFASRCPVLNITLDWSCCRDNGRKILPSSPSLDRIDPERGYTKGNVWIISYRANTIKSDASHEELKLVTKAVGQAIVNSLEF